MQRAEIAQLHRGRCRAHDLCRLDELRGRLLILLAPGMDVRTANITQDKETRIGNWTDEQIKTAVTKGLSSTGGHIAPPMPFPWFKNVTPEDLDAVVAYLRTVPPILNKVERTAFQMKDFP